MKKLKLQHEQDREMNRYKEIDLLEKKRDAIMKKMIELEKEMAGKTMTKAWDDMMRTMNAHLTDTALIERKLRNLRMGKPALGYAASDHTTGHFINVNQTAR